MQVDDREHDEGLEAPGAYAWEKGFERTWEGVEEDEEGNLKTASEAGQRRRRARKIGGESIKRGMIRYLYLALDMSKTMSEGDMRPNRLAVTLRIVQEFVNNFFDQNPLSQLGIIVTREGRAEKVTDLSGNPKAHVEALKKDTDIKGDASLQNLLELACTSLRAVPEYGSREVAVLYASLSTCDPGDIHETLGKLARHKIRASVVGLGAEMYICRRVAELTKGDYTVATDEHHYRDSLLALCTPPPTLADRGPLYADLVKMGFPEERQDVYPSLGYSGNQQELSTRGYTCPRCKTKTAELPSECVICSLPLVSSPHLARSYHHLFPVPTFRELPAQGKQGAAGGATGDPIVPAPGAATTAAAASGGGEVAGATKAALGTQQEQAQAMSCSGCLRVLSDDKRQQAVATSSGAAGAGASSQAAVALAFQCPDCGWVFCLECDMYIHDSLHNCPGCC